MPEVQLICMPFAAVERPSIAIGTLQSLLKREGIQSAGIYGNIGFSDEVGHAVFRFWEDALGDLVFAAAAFPEYQPDLSDYIRQTFTRRQGEAAHYGIATTFAEFEAAAHDIRRRAALFIERLAHELLDDAPQIVGCTSMYWQHTASLAILRRIRQLRPSVITMLGGANCEGTMGLATHRNFDWVDYVVSGDADDLIGPLCSQLLQPGRAISLPAGVFGPIERRTKYALVPQGLATPRAEVKNLNQVPTPNFDDYFRALETYSVGSRVRPGLLIETARGCWYGQIHQCKFCGISKGGLKFTAKSPDRVLDEFEELEHRYNTSAFEVTDNILSMGFFSSVLPRLAARRERLRIFWETKANLKRWQVKLLAKAGVSWVQPGIESLDSRTLTLMDKGVQASQNLQLLRWCREEGIRVAWNILWGLPGESDSWYREMADLIPLLHHLQPPRLAVRMRYDRYSVYHSRAAEYGLELQPMKYMGLSYPVPAKDLTELAYYFEAVSQGESKPQLLRTRPGVVAMCAAVREWKERFWRGLPPVLSLSDSGRELSILDTRDCAHAQHTVVSGIERETYLACEAMPLRVNVAAGHAVESLKRRKLLLELDGRLVALGLWGAIPELPPASAFPGGTVASDSVVPATNGTSSRELRQSGRVSSRRALSSFDRDQHGLSNDSRLCAQQS